MAHKQKKDPFVPIAFLIGIAILGGAVFVLVSNLFNTISNNSIKGAEDHRRQEAVANESLKPVGSVTTTADVAKNAKTTPATPVVAGSINGEEIYKATCFACHGTGAAGAPVLGNKEHWEPRVATGLDALMGSALNGKGAMPVKGGNPALSDAEIKAAILYMTKQAGFDLNKESDASATPVKKADTVEKTTSNAKEDATQKMATEKTPKKEETSTVEPSAPAKPEPVAEPKKPETPKAPEAPTPKEETAVEKPEKVTAPEKSTSSVPATETAKVATSTANGKAVYNGTCFACHKTGVAGAPLFGNKELWAPRIATGMDALVHSALNGKGAMPPKGGNTALSDDEVKAAVAYMVNNAK